MLKVDVGMVYLFINISLCLPKAERFCSSTCLKTMTVFTLQIAGLLFVKYFCIKFC